MEKEKKGVQSLYYMFLLVALVVVGGGWMLYSSFSKVAEMKSAKAAEKVYPPSVDLYAVCFGGSKNNLWAVGQFGTVIHSNNGGKSWIRQNSGIDESLIGVDFINHKSGWMISPKTLFNTEDGGKTWEKVKEFSMDMTTLKFYDQNNGWIVGEENIFHTSDGGKTWVGQKYNGDPTIFRSIAVLSPEEAWIAGELGRVFHTVDAGNSWEEKSPENANTIFSIDALSSDYVWTVGLNGEIFYTSDGGENWVASDIQNKRNLYSVKILSDLKAIVAGDGQFSMTFLKGKDWRSVLVDKSIEYKWLYDISHFGETMCAVGQGGEFSILLSENRGKKWTSVQYD